MIIFALVVFLFLPFLNYFFNNKKQINSVVIISPFFIVFNLLTVLLIGILNLNYNQSSPLYIFIFFIWIIITIVSLIVPNFKYKKEIFNKYHLKNALYKFLPMLICMILFIIISLFVNSYFPDTQAYLSASKDYQNGLEMSFHDGGTQISIHYKVMPQLITYSCLSSSDLLPIAYYLFNPFLICLIYASLTNEWINKKTTEIKWNIQYIFNLVIVSIIGIVCPFLSSFLTSGNIFNQSVILLISFGVLFYNKNSSWTSLLTLSIVQFLSPTGYINGFLLGFGLLIFILIYRDFKNIYLSLMFLAILFPLPTFLFNNFFNVFRQLIYIGSLAWITIFAICYKIFKDKIKLINNKINLLANFNWYDYLTYGLLILCALLIPLVFYQLYPKHFLYTRELSFLTMVLFILMFAYCLWFKIKKQQKCQFHVFFIISSLLSLIFIGLSIATKKDNYSTWRIIYLNFGMGGPIDIVLLVYLLLIIVLTKFKFNVNRLVKINVTKMNIFSFIMLAILTGFSVYNSLPTAVRLFSVSSNVNQNLEKISAKDKQELAKYNKVDINMFLDVQVNYLIDKANINSDEFFYNFMMGGSISHGVTNWTISAYSLYGVINIYESNLANKNELILTRMQEMINDNTINTLVLDKNTLYYNYLYTNLNQTFNNQYIGDGLTILSKL